MDYQSPSILFVAILLLAGILGAAAVGGLMALIEFLTDSYWAPWLFMSVAVLAWFVVDHVAYSRRSKRRSDSGE